MQYRALLTAPRAFLTRQQEDPDRLVVVALLVASGLVPLVAQLSLLSAVVIETSDGPTLSYVVGDQTTRVAVSSLAGSLISFASALAYWLVATVGAYLLTLPVADAGDLRTTFWIVGWGFVPPLLSGLFWLAAMLVSIQSTPTPDTVAASSEFVRAVQQTQLVQATRYLDFAAIAWAGGLWTVGVRVVRDVSWWQAAVAALPGIGIQLLPYLII